MREGSCVFSFASQPDIVRASQKDEYYRKFVCESALHVIQDIFGPRFIMAYNDYIRFTSEMLYYGLTVLRGRPTLGEEHCDLLHVNGRMIPLSRRDRVLLFILELCVPYLCERVLLYLRKVYRSELVGGGWCKVLAEFLPLLKNLCTGAKKLHVAIFYLQGSYYHFAKRLLGIRYISVNRAEGPALNYSVLGFLIIFQLFLSSIFALQSCCKLLNRRDGSVEMDLLEEQRGWLHSKGKCSLCLETRTFTTATNCGHLYCWNCIFEWCNSKSECPLCRSPLKKNELIPVYNYQA